MIQDGQKDSPKKGILSSDGGGGECIIIFSPEMQTTNHIQDHNIDQGQECCFLDIASPFALLTDDVLLYKLMD